jgi:glycosyltransferase involved in cell wall biosynthesis
LKPQLRTAIVHEWLVGYAGSERVLEQLLHVYPDADVFSVVDFLSTADRARVLGGKQTKTTFLQSFPGARTRYRQLLPLMPLAMEQHDLSAYDIVISSSHAVAKGVLTGPRQLHISYVHSPMRYAWDLQHQYLSESGLDHGIKSWLARGMLHYMRLWDMRTAPGVDQFVANSAFIARRIEKAYGRSAHVIYPPVDVDAFSCVQEKQDFYLTASRMVPYKKIPLIVEAFARMPKRKLVVIGAGPEYARVARMASANVELRGYQSGPNLRAAMQQAKAFVFAAEEDFGITLVEAQACGTPVIAFGQGGALETVRAMGHHAAPTGLFFEEQTPEAICAAVERFEAARARLTSSACRANAERFSIGTFRDQIEALVADAWQRHMRSPPPPSTQLLDAALAE